MDGGASRAIVYGVAESWTRLLFFNCWFFSDKMKKGSMLSEWGNPWSLRKEELFLT